MVRALAAYLLLFWLLGLVVHLDWLAHLFAGLAVVLLAIDLIANYTRTSSFTAGRPFSRRQFPSNKSTIHS